MDSQAFLDWQNELWCGMVEPKTWGDWPQGLRKDLCKAIYLSGHSVDQAEVLLWRITNFATGLATEYAAEVTKKLRYADHGN